MRISFYGYMRMIYRWKQAKKSEKGAITARNHLEMVFWSHNGHMLIFGYGHMSICRYNLTPTARCVCMVGRVDEYIR